MIEKNWTHRDQIIKMFSSAFKIKTMKAIKEVLSKTVSVISLMMFYRNRKIVVYKVIVSVIYSVIDNSICIDYLCILQNSYLLTTPSLGKTKFNVLSELGISEIRMNIISCHGLSKSTISTVILTCRSYFVPYYFPKVIFNC